MSIGQAVLLLIKAGLGALVGFGVFVFVTRAGFVIVQSDVASIIGASVAA